MLFDGSIFGLNLFLLYINIPDDDISNMIPVASATFFSEYYQATNIKHSQFSATATGASPTHMIFITILYQVRPKSKKAVGLASKTYF